MVEFSLHSASLPNLRNIARTVGIYREHTCSIIINDNFTIELPVVVASSLSKEITRIIENDPTQNIFNFKLKCNNENILNKIKHVLTCSDVIDIEEEEINAFAEFGLLLGNDEFISPLKEKLIINSNSMCEDNVSDILNSKRIFCIKET